MIHKAKMLGSRRDGRTGQPLYKRLYVKIIVADEFLADSPKTVRVNKECYYQAPAGKFYTPSDIEETIFQIVMHIDRSFAKHDFRMVQLAPNRFTFICTGERGFAPSAMD